MYAKPTALFTTTKLLFVSFVVLLFTYWAKLLTVTLPNCLDLNNKEEQM